MGCQQLHNESSLSNGPVVNDYLYGNQEVLKFEIHAPFDALLNKGNPVSANQTPVEVDAKVIFEGKEILAEVEQRGRTSLEACKFFKFKVSISDETAAEGTPFDRPSSFKIGTHCDKRHPDIPGRLGDERATYREHLLYRIFTKLTDVSYNSRRALIRYKSTDSSLDITKKAFIHERYRHIARRLDLERALEAGQVAKVDQNQLALIYLFQMFAINTDWKIAGSNMEFKLPEGAVPLGIESLFNAKNLFDGGKHFFVPYDFDLAGMVTGDDGWRKESKSPFFLKDQEGHVKSYQRWLAMGSHILEEAPYQAAIKKVLAAKQAIEEEIERSDLDPEALKYFRQRSSDFFKALAGGSWKTLPFLKESGVVPVFKDAQGTDVFCRLRTPQKPLLFIHEELNSRVKASVLHSENLAFGSCPGNPTKFILEPAEMFWIEKAVIGNL